MPPLKRLAAKALFGRLIVGGEGQHGRALALTMDDGPHPANTPRLLDEFERKGVRATFFLVGQEAEKYPEITRMIDAAGHQVASHGHSHLNAKRVSAGRYVADIEKGHATLEQILGRTLVRDVRPPYGGVTAASLAMLLFKGYRVVLWTFDTLDSSISVPEDIIDRIRRHTFQPGDILLAHDDYPHTVEAMPSLIASLHAQDFELCTLSKMISDEYPAKLSEQRP